MLKLTHQFITEAMNTRSVRELNNDPQYGVNKYNRRFTHVFNEIEQEASIQIPCEWFTLYIGRIATGYFVCKVIHEYKITRMYYYDDDGTMLRIYLQGFVIIEYGITTWCWDRNHSKKCHHLTLLKSIIQYG